VAMTVEYPASVFSVDNQREVEDLVGALDWALADATLGPKIDSTKIATSGHSLGGKLALLTATMDSRIKAVFTLDPVDGGGPLGCSAPTCVMVSPLLANLHVPTGFIGETTDASGGLQPCAPAADNYTTFFATATSPSLEVTALGANHVSFVSDVMACGLTCSFCNAATATNANVNAMAQAFLVAFFERHLRGLTGYDAYLTGAQAQSRYVSSNQATITAK
jgi:dienelactone hydrolase